MSRPGSNVEERIPYMIVFVKNLERSVEFYHERLGLPKRDLPVNSKMGGVGLAVQGTTLVLMDQAEADRTLPAGPNGDGIEPGRCHMSFAVADLDVFHAIAVTGGVECVQLPRGDEFGKFAVYRDPDGLLFSVVEAKKPTETQGVVLSGGGALGAFELGVLSVLADDSSQPDPVIFTGTSVGGFNAAVLACEYTTDKKLRHAVDRLMDVWRNRVAGGLHDNGVFRLRGDISRLLGGTSEPLGDLLGDAAYLSIDFTRRMANFATSSASPAWRMIEMMDVGSMISTEPLQNLVKEFVPWERVQQSPRVLKVAATNWETGKLQLFVHYPAGTKPSKLDREEVEMSEETAQGAVMASAAIPGLFPSVAVPGPAGTPFVDGGVVMNSPLNPAIDAGADVIHLICLNPELNTLPLRPISNTIDSVTRLLVASAAGNVATDLDRARFVNSVAGVARRRRTGELYRPVTIHRYHPKPGNLGGLAGMLDFSRDHMEALITDGVDIAKNHDCKAAGCVLPHQPL